MALASRFWRLNAVTQTWMLRFLPILSLVLGRFVKRLHTRHEYESLAVIKRTIPLSYTQRNIPLHHRKSTTGTAKTADTGSAPVNVETTAPERLLYFAGSFMKSSNWWNVMTEAMIPLEAAQISEGCGRGCTEALTYHNFGRAQIAHSKHVGCE